jgi:V/A-type H+/Na+-transporting ATPase subunit E
MNEIETGNDKIKKICDAIKTQTIEPAKQRANEILENAKLEAIEIKKRAEYERESLLRETEKEIAKKQNLCLSSIKSASRQIIDQLKQEIESDFFNKNLHDLVVKASIDPALISKLITAIIRAIEKDGIDTDLSAIVAKEAGADKITLLLAADILGKLREKKVVEGGFSGGAKIKLLGKQITIDISDEALIELISKYIRKEFRDIIFKP